MAQAANDNQRQTLSWGTQFLMLSFAVAADVAGLVLTAIGILMIALGPWALGGGAVAGAIAGASQGCKVDMSLTWKRVLGGVAGMGADCVQDAAGNIAAGAGIGGIIIFFLGYGSFVLDWILVAFVGFSFWLWFKLKAGHGVRRKSASKRPLYMAVNVAVESVFGFVPGWTIFTFLSIQEVKKEDERYNKKMSEEQQASYRTRRAANDNQPRYQRGARLAA